MADDNKVNDDHSISKFTSETFTEEVQRDLCPTCISHLKRIIGDMSESQRVAFLAAMYYATASDMSKLIHNEEVLNEWLEDIDARLKRIEASTTMFGKPH